MSIIQSVIEANLDNIRSNLPESKQGSDSFAFLIFAITAVLDVTINEAILSSTEGSGDGGIDAIYIDETEDNIIIHIFQSKYRTNLNKGIGKNEIDLTIAKVEEIFQGKKVENQSEIIRARIDEIRDIIKSTLKMPEVHIHFVVNTEHKPSEAEKERIKILKERGNYFCFFYNGNELLQAIDTAKSKDIKITITTCGDILHADDKKLGDIRCIVSKISASELVRIYEEAGRDRILNRNIRYFLGNNKINKRIRETASSADNSKYFWFLNNGVTIVCDKFSFTDDSLGNKRISIANPKIINGGQTTKSLYNEIKSSPEKTLQDVYLLLRLYETDNEALIDRITEGTNSQNPIFERDLKANHPVQLLVKEYFLKKGYYYETHRKEYVGQKIDNNKIANNERVFQAYVSLFKNMPHEAKSSKSKIFEKYFDSIFDDRNDNLPQQLLISHNLLTFVEKQAKKHYNEWKNGDVFLNHAELAMVYTIGKIYPKIKIDETVLDDVTLLEIIYSMGVFMLRNIIGFQKKTSIDYSHNKFFKSREFTILIEKLSADENFIGLINKIISVRQNDSVVNAGAEFISELFSFEQIAVLDDVIRRLYGIQRLA